MEKDTISCVYSSLAELFEKLKVRFILGLDFNLKPLRMSYKCTLYRNVIFTSLYSYFSKQPVLLHLQVFNSIDLWNGKRYSNIIKNSIEMFLIS